MEIIYKIYRQNSRTPQKAFNKLAKDIKEGVQNKAIISTTAFSYTLDRFGKDFQRYNMRHIMTYKAWNLAESLVAMGSYNLAGIVYNQLEKLNEKNPALKEAICLRSLAIAKKQKDMIHIMARSYDLSEIYRKTEYGSKKHLKYLEETDNALEKIISDYATYCMHYKTINTAAKPVNNYKFMQVGVKLAYARAIIERNPLAAIKKLEEAQEIMEEFGEGKIMDSISELLDKAYSLI